MRFQNVNYTYWNNIWFERMDGVEFLWKNILSEYQVMWVLVKCCGLLPQTKLYGDCHNHQCFINNYMEI